MNIDHFDHAAGMIQMIYMHFTFLHVFIAWVGAGVPGPTRV